MDKAFFKQLDQQHLSADNRRNIKTILGVLDERYSEITASGNLNHYQDYAKLATLDVSPKAYEILSYDIKVLSDSSVLSFYKLKEKNSNTLSFRSNIWLKSDENWQLIFHQGTPVIADED
ncbi:hypothetical protein RU86_GL000570 [Lactococcus piscium]|uniref:DUF4440 domain-containing protein n=1 Tax=Pseudolactococcus piscium TaxID=1364 RepID=A0A2A5RX53_9LACT|nr:DUF4440 domain-containing protein [Lactococcus piscium]PCS05815.1 hypothetical protein RU86_GL000570 [Lactococcus piscium]